ncbi:MAG: putative membrane protein [Paracoccaceae bacterium]|jgi:uncharacterized membrane protein
MKWMVSTFCACLLWAGACAAEPFPALYDVSGVAADDVLNVRRTPESGADLLGTLAPDLRGVEVVATDTSGRWGLVNLGESAGWASLRYLRRQHDNPDYALGATLWCSGTEPFWSLRLSQGKSAEFSTPSETIAIPGVGLITAGTSRPDRFFVGLGGGSITILRREICSDGMSDQSFGIGIDLLTDHGGVVLYSGCCSVVQS